MSSRTLQGVQEYESLPVAFPETDQHDEVNRNLQALAKFETKMASGRSPTPPNG